MAQGHQILAEALQKQGIEYCFGIVGVPVIELGMSIQNVGINYYGCRNEQAAAYSAQAVGYLTGRPGLCLSVSGPGMTNCISGLANAKENCWPMILVGGSSDLRQTGMGGFQEMDQVEAARPYVKMAVRITNLKQIPFLVEKAVRVSLSGRPGPVYLDVPGDLLLEYMEDTSDIVFLAKFQNPVKSMAPYENISKAVSLLKQAKNPLIIIGKGAAYANASEELIQFVENTQIPFIPTPMGKGVIDDDHKLCVIPARSRALQNADVVLLVGARLNWILHFGQPPRFKKDVKIIQIDILPEEFGQNIQSEVALCGDIKLVVQQLNWEHKNQGSWKADIQQWYQNLVNKVNENKSINRELMEDKEIPMQYYSAFNTIIKHLPQDFILVSEGANTMDIGRTIINHKFPKRRLDAGTFGTMGLAMPFALAAKAVNPKKPVVAIVGDSSFGFSAMEVETATRYNLPFVVIIINNNGIFTGVEELPENAQNGEYPVTALNPKSKYELIAEAFGGLAFRAKNHEELEKALKTAYSNEGKLSIINVSIAPTGARKPQEHQWLTKNSTQSSKL